MQNKESHVDNDHQLKSRLERKMYILVGCWFVSLLGVHSVLGYVCLY